MVEFIREQTDLSKNDLFVDFMREWLENLRPSIEENTYESYLFTFNKHIKPFFEPKKIKTKDITPTHIQQYIRHKTQNVSANTVRKHLVNISKCLDSAVKQNIIAFNSVKRIDLPKKTKIHRGKIL